LLLSGDLLQTVEFFTVQLVQLGVYVFDGVLGAGYDDMLTAACQKSSGFGTG
jgi:hypothetical protein